MTPEKEKDYYPGEVNPEDLQFLLWHYLQCMEKQAGGVLNPENPAFEELANQIYDYLSEEFQRMSGCMRCFMGNPLEKTIICVIVVYWSGSISAVM